MAGNPFRKSQFLSLDVGAAREAAAADIDTSQAPATSTITQGKSCPLFLPPDEHRLSALQYSQDKRQGAKES